MRSTMNLKRTKISYKVKHYRDNAVWETLGQWNTEAQAKEHKRKLQAANPSKKFKVVKSASF